MARAIIQTKRIKPQLCQNLEPRIDQSETLNKNHVIDDRLVRLTCKFSKSITETSSKIQEYKIYDKVISNPIHSNR